MSRTANCIKMLQMLNSGRIIKISEFAEEFETNPRNIIEYRKELEDAGYSIITIPGKDGGYKLEKTDLIPSIKLLPQEKELVLETINYITSKKDFIKKSKINDNNTYVIICILCFLIMSFILYRTSFDTSLFFNKYFTN